MLPKIKVLKPDHVFDNQEAMGFRQKINDLLEDGVRIFLVDLKKVTFMDSSGLGALVLALKAIQAKGGRLFLMSINEQIQMLFELTNMIRTFEIVIDQADLEERLRRSQS